jgi:hypothetical protein
MTGRRRGGRLTEKKEGVNEERKNEIKIIEKITIALSIIAIIVSIACVILSQQLVNAANQRQQESYQQNVAQALYFDINILQSRFNNIRPVVNNTISLEQNPFYTSDGLYFIFDKDIANFEDTNLSSNLYAYYTLVLQIESERSAVEQIADKYQGGMNVSGTNAVPVSTADATALIVDYNDMVANIGYSEAREQIIVQRLKQDYNVSEPQPGNYVGEMHMFTLNPPKPS